MQKALNHARRDAVLSYVARDMGFSSVDALLTSVIKQTEHEPFVCLECYSLTDSKSVWCNCCHTDGVKSVLVVAELV